MRVFAYLIVLEAPLAALAWSARHMHAAGFDGGIYWLLGFAAIVLVFFVADAAIERRLG